MFELSIDETYLVSGGLETEPGDIVVTGPGGGLGAGDIVSPSIGGAGSADGGSGSGSEAPAEPMPTSHPTPNASKEANDYADQHLRIYGTTKESYYDYQHVHDDLAHLYDIAKNNPNQAIYIGHGQSITAEQAMAAMDHTTFVITENAQNSKGAWTRPDGSYHNFVVTIDSTSNKMQSYTSLYGEAGVNYVIAHEMGHVLNNVYNNHDSSEQSANSAGRSIEQMLDQPLMSSDPEYGYN